MKVKIGEEIKFKEGFEIESFGGKKKIVKEGDRGVITKHGVVKYLSGDAKGMLQKIEELEVKGCDHENIVNMIFNRLNSAFNLRDMLEQEDIEEKEFKEEIEDLLYDFI